MKTKMHFDAYAKLFQYATDNRLQPTQTEALLWDALRRKKGVKSTYKFRRQHPVNQYILDFYCHSKKVAIEIDGGYHFNEEQKKQDQRRTEDLNGLGIVVIRFTNEQVLSDITGVLETIWRALEEIPE